MATVTPAPIAEPTVAGRLEAVRARIAGAGRDPATVTVVAVTKGFGADAITAARAVGLDALGENYAQELEVKAASDAALVEPRPQWHFLGSPQRNKIARLAPIVALWQGMDRAVAIDRLASVRPGAAVLVQVNVNGDPAKAGCAPGEAPGLVERARSHGLDVRGLMCVGPRDDPGATRSCFAALADLAAETAVEELSMGMSDDFEAAVAAGSTMVRLGRILFGPRPGTAAA
jgi:pyridoxal phosphate enzyme (YggS family)